MNEKNDKAAPVSRDVPAARAGETYTIKGGSSVTWGSQDTVSAPSNLGTLIQYDLDAEAKFESVENNQGAVTGIVIYDTETTLKVTIVAGSSATLPAPGDTLTIGSVSATIIKASSRAQNKSTKKFEIEAHKWANLTLS